jgi:protease-4
MAKQPEQQSFGKRIFVSVIILIALLVVGSLFAALLGDDLAVGANTAIISINGPLSADAGSGLLSDWTSSTEIVRELEEARDDPAIRAVILEINSPGGSAVASDEIAQAVKDVRASDKIVVAWIREVGASGAYWVASSADHVVANRMSVTGSIGVISSYLSFERFLDRYNVTYNRLVAGERKDVGDPLAGLSESDRYFLQGKLDRVHAFFIEEVARNRNLTRDQVAAVEDGRFLLGVEALDTGLVDELGGRAEAVAYLEKVLNETVTTVEYEPERSFIDELLGLLGGARRVSAQDALQYVGTQADAPVPQLR